MQEPPRSYVLCGTPRTGSTLLCSLLYSTGVLGRPESYFRELDEVAWAARFGLATEGGRVRDYRAFVNAAHSAGASDNGVFGVRIMWGSLERVIEGLGGGPGESDLPILEEALGPLTFVHLRREDIAAQTVSWCRAEQTGYWQQGDVITQEPHPDIAQTGVLMRTIWKRSEEHTSELQSRQYLVCRLLLEKKKYPARLRSATRGDSSPKGQTYCRRFLMLSSRYSAVTGTTGA